MRQLLVQVPEGDGRKVLSIACKHHGSNLAVLPAHNDSHATDLAIVHVSNARVEGLLADLEHFPKLHVTLMPEGIIVLHPPASSAPQQVQNVQHLSPIEVFLSGIQSVGSWRGFLGYAVAAAITVWIAMFTNTTYLLVAAMLIAPFAGPAMNAALASARGDVHLLGRSLLRYTGSLAVSVVVAGLLSLGARQHIATPLMVSQSEISAAAVLLPIVAGAAGALNLMQSRRSSLVSGAAVGMLVAASLSPPAGLIGMAAALGRWDMVKSGAFLLLLQLVGINLAGGIVFRLYGVSSRGTRYSEGTAGVFPVVMACTALFLGGLLAWQFSSKPSLQRSSRVERATATITRSVNDSGVASLVSAQVRFTRPDIHGENTLLATIYVQSRNSPLLVRKRLTSRLQRNLQAGFNVTPLVDVIVLHPPGS